MNTNYDNLISKDKILLSIKDIDNLGIIKSDMCKKLIFHRQIEITKIGKKNNISRSEIIRYLKYNTISVNEFEDKRKISA